MTRGGMGIDKGVKKAAHIAPKPGRRRTASSREVDAEWVMESNSGLTINWIQIQTIEMRHEISPRIARHGQLNLWEKKETTLKGQQVPLGRQRRKRAGACPGPRVMNQWCILDEPANPIWLSDVRSAVPTNERIVFNANPGTGVPIQVGERASRPCPPRLIPCGGPRP